MLNERIKNLRVNSGMTQNQMADRLHVSAVTVSCWETGKKAPSLEAIKDISHLFGVSVDSILNVNSPVVQMSNMLGRDELSLLANYRKLDGHGKKAVSTICSLELDRVLSTFEEPQEQRMIRLYDLRPAAGSSAPLDDSGYTMIPASGAVPMGAEYCVRISGNSMYPYINDGDIVYVERAETLRQGDVGIISVDGSLYCKQYICKPDGTLILASANPELRHTNVVVKPDGNSFVKVFGRVLLDKRVDFPHYLLNEM